MKVAVVHNLNTGGARRRLSQQMASLHESFQIAEYTLSTGVPIHEDAVVVNVVRRAPTSPKSVRPILRYVDLAELFLAYRNMSKIIARDKPDVIWLNPCQFLQAPAVIAPVSTPTFYYCDEPRRADYEEAAKAKMNPATKGIYAPMRSLERRADRKAVRSVTAIATNSKFTAARITNAYGRSADVIYCGVAEEFFAPGSSAPKHFLSVGTLIPTKGHDLAIDAVAASGVNLPLIIVGSRGDVNERQRLQQRALQHNVAMEIRSDLSDIELSDLYQQALATIYLAADEPFGLVSIEAQAAHCPVIGANEGGLPETIQDGLTGFLVGRDGAIAGAALAKLADKDLRYKMGDAASEHAQQFSWEKSGIAIANRLQDLVAR